MENAQGGIITGRKLGQQSIASSQEDGRVKEKNQNLDKLIKSDLFAK